MPRPLLSRRRRAAHPRSRGEHTTGTPCIVAGGGSSPLARGTCPGRARRGSSWRLIPARAGNMSRASAARVFMAAHPRSRGEHRRHLSSAHGCRGSSPLARGTLLQLGSGDETVRLIPARAGNISSKISCMSSGPAHPRSRGEHKKSQVVLSQEFGSSPLARGT